MNFQGKAVLVYLEEDNIARAYFRVQPLMTQDGPVGPMAAEYPDDGFLRIVPDKNEQHTFKERMRTLSGLCLVDLRFFPMDANKIRTNKNYSPTRGETNQFIVYSDAVRALPDYLVYQVVAEENVKSAVTPCVYIRKGANIQGPFRREDGQSAGETAQLPPDSGEIHSLTVNGQEAPAAKPSCLSAPAVFEITGLITGEDEFSFLSDNSYPGWPRDAIVYASAASDETQTNWNGILGYIHLRIEQPDSIAAVRVYPGNGRAEIRITLDLSHPFTGTLRISSPAFPADAEVPAPSGRTDSFRFSHAS